MKLKQIETEILNRIYAVAEFPQAGVSRLLAVLPPYSAVLPAGIYLLGRENPTGEELQYATALTAFTLSALIHRDVTEQRAFSLREGVLGGDYCLALALGFLPPSLSKTQGLGILKEFRRYNESCLTPTEPDYGSLLGKVAASTAPATWEETEKVRFTEAVAAVGRLWSEAFYHPETAGDEGFTRADAANYGHPFAPELRGFLEEYKGACH